MSHFESSTGNRPAHDDSLEHPCDAAQWFARMQSGEVSDDDRRAFEAWRMADPEHEQQYRRLAYIWQATLAVPESRLQALMHEQDVPPVRPWLARRRLGLGLAGACTLAVAGVAGVSRGWFAAEPESLTLMTRRGERHQATLPDGSILHMNFGTRVVVRFEKGLRLVELRQGEAFFEVSHDAARPFVVNAGMGRVTVTGTRFNVRRDAASTQVSVESGSVRVDNGRWWARNERRLSAGQQVVAYADQTLGEVGQADVTNLVAWQRGRMVFNDVALAEVIDEMNRYLAQPARLATAALGQLRVSGVFGVDDPEAMIDALPAIAPVQVIRLLDGRIRIAAR
ncbi:FecR family protein [Corticimicrobacter populi]|uniref:Iron dicitrate transport regulator FecR n=1 Tax=Corticimicrobacter populi TaxID=2175229 RepID=A0A2V1K2F9_9BURK|nr:FecR family protein [Corticimicrobacter populi]PWF23817.1 hypothetical protein DD235_05600 [Corticimicrobacter populi]